MFLKAVLLRQTSEQQASWPIPVWSLRLRSLEISPLTTGYPQWIQRFLQIQVILDISGFWFIWYWKIDIQISNGLTLVSLLLDSFPSKSCVDFGPTSLPRCKVLAPMLTALIREDAPGWEHQGPRYPQDFKGGRMSQTFARLEIMENRALWSWPVDIYMGAVAQLTDVGLCFWSWKSSRHASLVIHVGENPTWQGGNPWKHPTFVDVIMSNVSMYFLKSVRFPFMFIGKLRIWHGEYHCQAGLCSDGEVSAGDTSGWLLRFCHSDMDVYLFTTKEILIVCFIFTIYLEKIFVGSGFWPWALSELVIPNLASDATRQEANRDLDGDG